MVMEGYSSGGSTTHFISEVPDPTLPRYDVGSWTLDEIEEMMLFGNESGLLMETNDFSGSLNDPLNQVDTSEASFQTKTGCCRPKLTPAQRKENKRKSDLKFRQKLKKKGDEQTAEIKRLKEENERVNAENRRLKVHIRLLQLQAAAPLGQDSCITQSTDNQLQHPSVPLQYYEVLDHNGTSSVAADKLSTMEMNVLQNLQEMVPVNVVATNGCMAQNQTNNSQARECNNGDADVTDILIKLEADDESKVKFSDFTGLDGERITLGRYSFPHSLHPIVKKILDAYGDVSASSKMNRNIVEMVYIIFCASIKEMSDLQLKQVTEDRILKWRDAIKDALRINFKVDFAMKHLKKIACAYIGLIERQKLNDVAFRISKLETELSAEKEEHAKICERSMVFMDATEEFNSKPVSSVMFPCLPTLMAAT